MTTDPTGTTLTVPDSPEMLRETLRTAQALIERESLDEDRALADSARLQRLIEECDARTPATVDARPQHGMIPGSHERPAGAECRCGAAWDRWNDRCAAPATVDADLRATAVALASDLVRHHEDPTDGSCWLCDVSADNLTERLVAALTSAGWPQGYVPDNPHVQQAREARERLTQLVASILDVAADLEDDRPERLPLSPRKLAAALRSLAQPGLDPAMNDGWTLRTLTLGIRDLERFLAEQGFETGSVDDGPYPPWEVAVEAIADLRMDLAAEKDQTQHLANEVERLTIELVDLVDRAGGITLHRDQVERERDELGRIVVETRIASGNPDGATPLPAVVATLRAERDAARAEVERLTAQLAEAQRHLAVHFGSTAAIDAELLADVRLALGVPDGQPITVYARQIAAERDDERERADTLARKLAEVARIADEMRDTAAYWGDTDTGRRISMYADLLGEVLDDTTPASEPRIVACTCYSGQFGQPHEQGCAALEALTAAERERDAERERADTLARDLAEARRVVEATHVNALGRELRTKLAEVIALRTKLAGIAGNADLVEAAAAEAFFVDDVGGHHKQGRQPHTWQNIPEQGRENYRALIRAVLTVVSRALLDDTTPAIPADQPATEHVYATPMGVIRVDHSVAGLPEIPTAADGQPDSTKTQEGTDG